MIPNEITESPRLLFLGAGASKPLGKMLMGEFVEHLRGQIHNKTYANLVTAISRFKPDLEFLMEELEAISTKGYLGNSETLRRGDGEPYTVPAVSPEMGSLAALATGALQLVKREVYHHYRELDKKARINLLEGVVSRMGTAPGCMVVFTTNYDPSIETLCRSKGWRLVDGFEHDALLQQYSWNRSVFDAFKRTAEPTVVLFKIHGSTNWILDAERLVKSLPIHTAGAVDGYQNAMIYPATRKVAISEPYFTCYDYLEKCLSHAEFCLVVGYSFRDYDVLMRFRAATISNDKLRIAILDPNAQKLCKEISQYKINASPINASLGDDPPAFETLIDDWLNGRAKKRRIL
jgi:hypothetical protein